MSTGLLHAADEEAALAELHRLGCTDGLPVVIPTPARVERMVLAAVDDPTTSLGVMGPLNSAKSIVRTRSRNTPLAACLFACARAAGMDWHPSNL